MDERVLTARFELHKGKHFYVFDPSGFDKENDIGSPIFYLDDKLIHAQEDGARAFEEAVYLICGCDDYKERERRFDAEESYKKQRYDPEFGWDCVATCNHISLVKRYFAKPLLEEVIQEIAKDESNPALVTSRFFQSREAGIFPRMGFKVSAEYLKQHNR